jgi:hypothetical protein
MGSVFVDTPAALPTGGMEGVSLPIVQSEVRSDVFRVCVSVEQGLHRGASLTSEPSTRIRLGSACQCDLVLLDEGVAAEALCFFEQDGLLCADVLAEGVFYNGEALAMGVKVFDAPLPLLRAGDAELRVELLRSSTQLAAARGRVPAIAIAPVKRSWAALTMTGVVLVTTLAVVGGAVNASSHQAGRQDLRTLSEVIQPFNNRGGHVAVLNEFDGQPQVRGLVTDALAREQLEHQIRALGIKADVQVHDVQQIAESLSRLARLIDHPCEAHHLGAGRFECDAGVADQSTVARLQALVAQVPGAVALEVNARAPAPAFAALPELKMVPVPALTLPPKIELAALSPSLKLPVIKHIAVGERESFAYDSAGRRLRVGDTMDGAKIVQIRFDGVELLRGKQRYTIKVTVLASAANFSAH